MFLQLPIPLFPIAFDIRILLVMAAVITIMVIIVVLVKTRTKTKPDVYGLIIDESDGSVSLMQFLKLSDRVYAAINTSYPLFLIIPHTTKTYMCHAGKAKVPCVLGYARSLLALPLDPKVTSAVSAFLDTEEHMKLSNEETIKLLRQLYDMEEKKIGRIRLSSPSSVAIAFDVKKIVSDIINKVFEGASEAVIHYFRSARNIETLEKYLQSLARYAERRYSWLIYIAIIVMAVGIAVVLVMQVFK